MKSALMTIALLGFSGAALADIVSPNTYVCKNKAQKIEVIYSDTSYIGTPSFQLTVEGHSQSLLDGLKLDETTQSPIGKIVSAFDVNIQDVSLNYSLIIPNIALGNGVSEVEFTTKFVTTYSGGMFPPSFTGITQSNKMVDVKCKAIRAIY